MTPISRVTLQHFSIAAFAGVDVAAFGELRSEPDRQNQRRRIRKRRCNKKGGQLWKAARPHNLWLEEELTSQLYRTRRVVGIR
jgi:hypothetical protein